jgi:hypothetical protein
MRVEGSGFKVRCTGFTTVLASSRVTMRLGMMAEYRVDALC